MGSDFFKLANAVYAFIFQSTLPAWGATKMFKNVRLTDEISIHAPRMGSDHLWSFSSFLCFISIHAPRMGSDSYAIALI